MVAQGGEAGLHPTPPSRGDHQVEGLGPLSALQSQLKHLQALPSREVHPDAPPRARQPQQQGRVLLRLPAQALSLAIIEFSFWY